MQWWFKKFCRGDESFEDEEWSGWPSEFDNDQLRVIIEADPLPTTWEVAEELSVDHSMVIRHLKQIGTVKKLDKWVPHELTEKKKPIVSKSCLLLFYTTTINHFLIRLWHATKSGQLAIPSSVIIEKKLQTLLKANLHQKKGHGHW